MNLENDDFDDESSHAAALERTGYWGEMAAGLLFLAKDTGRLGIARRSDYVLEPDTYGTMGGAGNPGESPEQVAIREGGREETGYTGKIEMIPLVVFEHSSGFKYFNFLGVIDKEFEPELNWENSEFIWLDNLKDMPSPLHPGMKFLLENSQLQIEAEMAKYRNGPPCQVERAILAIEEINQSETSAIKAKDCKKV